MIEAVVWVVVLLVLAGCAYLVIRTVARWVRSARENRWLQKFYHEWAGRPIMMDLIVAQGFTPEGHRTGPTSMYYRGKEVHPWEWNRKVWDFEKEHWSTTAEREIRERSKPGGINYYDKKGEVNDGGTRGEKGSGNGPDTE